MTASGAALRCELHVRGHLDQHWSACFGGLALTHQNDGTTTLRGVAADQAELHGLLAKIRDLGVTIISLSVTAAADHALPSSSSP